MGSENVECVMGGSGLEDETESLSTGNHQRVLVG